MKNKKVLILIALVFMISLVGISYAFFEYYGVSANYQVSAGAVTLTLNEGKDYIDLTNIFPETKEEARERDDNVITFTVSGVNTTENKDIWYEIMLNEGDEEAGLTRFLPKELMFDLTEINPDGTKKLVVDNMNFGKFDDTRIWVNTILKDNETTFTRTYELRMWLSDKVLISDTVEGADYTTSEFRNRYASVRVSVFGDFNEKSAPYNYMKRNNTNSFWGSSILNQRGNVTYVNFVSLPQSEIEARYEAAPIKEDVTDTTQGGSVKAWLETNANDETKYVMYVASDGIMYFPSDCRYMFAYFSSVVGFNFENINTSKSTTMDSLFSGCSSLISLDVSNFDTSKVTKMNSMFSNCSKLVKLNVGNLDTSNVETMASMFYFSSSLIELDLSCFDTSSTTSMGQMFYKCTSLVKLDISNFDTSNVTNMSKMFSGCSSLTFLDLSSFNTSKVTDMTEMFMNCANLTSLDLSNFDTSNVTKMSSTASDTGMFNGCSSLMSLDISNFNTSKLTSMKGMFASCLKLTNLDVSSFDTSNVTDMAQMFGWCRGLKNLDVSNFDTSQVTNMSYMFKSCYSLSVLNLNNFIVDSLTNSQSMFSDCSNLITIYSNGDWNTVMVNSSDNMFVGCFKLVGAVPYNSSKHNITMANPTTGYFTIKPTEETPAA